MKPSLRAIVMRDLGTKPTTDTPLPTVSISSVFVLTQLKLYATEQGKNSSLKIKPCSQNPSLWLDTVRKVCSAIKVYIGQ